MENTQIPSVGRTVHYHAYGSPVLPDGTQKFPTTIRVAIITEVKDGDTVGLCVLNPLGVFFSQDCKFGKEPGNWSWPVKI